MKGVVFLEDRKLELREFPDPTPGPRDVILEDQGVGDVWQRSADLSRAGSAKRGSGGWHQVAGRGDRRAPLSAPQAVPVPQEMAAPVTKESSSGSGTSVDTGTFAT